MFFLLNLDISFVSANTVLKIEAENARVRPKFKNLFAYSKNNDTLRADFYIYATDRHIRLLSCTERPHLLDDSLDSLAHFFNTKVGSFVARTHTHSLTHQERDIHTLTVPALPLTINVLFIFYSILFCYCRSCFACSHSSSLYFSLTRPFVCICSMRFKSPVQFDFLQTANTMRTILYV